jgi:nucleotide-binding universal stress UspA family protein
MSLFNNHILVPIDFSEQSIIALKQSFNIARFSKSEITLIHVLDEDIIKPFSSLFSGKNDYMTHLAEDSRNRLEKLAAETEKQADIKVDTLIAKGKIYEEIARVATELKAVFIIMGTNGAVGFKKKFIGSNALRVIHEAPCPVITIKGKDHHEGCRTIVLPLDVSRESKEKVNKAIELATFFGSAIKIVTVSDTDDEFITHKLKRQMIQVKQFIADAGIDCTADYILGDDIAEEVIKFAMKNDADLILIMTQQEMIWKEYFLGSAPQEIINHSEIPVLSIRPIERRDMSGSVLS